MITIIAKKDENINVLLNRFKNACIREGLPKKMKEKEAYISPSRLKYEKKQKLKHLKKLERIKAERLEMLKNQGRLKVGV